MKQKLLVIALASAAVVAPQAQDQVRVQEWTLITEGARAEIERQAAVTPLSRVAVESRVTKGAPYAAESVTEFQQTLGDGNRIARRSVTKVYRDSDGRTRREQTNTSADGKETLSITIVDPVAGTSFTLDPESRTAYKVPGIMAMPSMVAPAGARGGGGGGARVGGPGTPGGTVVTPTGPVPLPSERPAAASGPVRAIQERTAQGPANTTKKSSASGWSRASWPTAPAPRPLFLRARLATTARSEWCRNSGSHPNWGSWSPRSTAIRGAAKRATG